MRSIINNISNPYDSNALIKYQKDVSESDQNKDKEIIRLILKIKTDCADADEGKVKLTKQISTDFDNLMELMDEREWENVPMNDLTAKMEVRQKEVSK